MNKESKSKKPAYIVRYSTGDYDTYFVHDHAVYVNKKDAENACKELNNYHFKRKSEFDKRGKRSWDNLRDKWDEYFDDHPEVFEPKIKYYEEGGKEEHERILQVQQDVFIDIVQENYPEWTREKCKEQIDLQEELDSLEYDRPGKAYIEEIDLIF